MKMKISNRLSFVLKVADGKHTVRCRRMGLPGGDEGATRCLRVNVSLGKGLAVQRHSV